MEAIPGAALVETKKMSFPEKVTREECERRCLREKDFECRSARFRLQNEYRVQNNEDVGKWTNCNSNWKNNHIFN